MNAAETIFEEQSKIIAAQKSGIVFEHVTKSFQPAESKMEVKVLHDITLFVPRQRFVVFLGSSGCGKTTLLRMVDGLIQPDSGTIKVLGESPKPGPDIGFVFQSFRLIPWLTVSGNIDFALQNTGLNYDQRRERVDLNLELVGLSKFRDTYPSELSGGMKQRVALARALAPNPKILLMDEPFASIDAQTRDLMQFELMQIWTVQKPIVLFVTHSVDEAIILADEVVLLGPRPGKVIEVIPIDLPRPRWAYDTRSDKRFIEFRSYLSNRMRELVFSDPASEFYGRDR